MAAVVVVDGRRLLSRRAPRSTSPSSRTRRERLRVGGCHRRRVGSTGRGGGASRGAHVPRGSCAEADGRRTGSGSRPPSPCRVCAAPAREAVESSAAQPIRAMSVRGTDRTRQCPLCGHGQAGAVWSGDLQGAHRGCVNARFRETAGLTGYPRTRVKSCEREKSGTSTVGRCGTHGGPPGRMILAQYVPRSTFRFLTELNALPPHGTNSRSFGTAALHGTTPPLDSPGLA